MAAALVKINFNCLRLSMAACKSVQEWLLPAKPLLIVRYLGTTPDSSSLAPLLTSICQQLSYTFMLPFEDIPDDLVYPCQTYFEISDLVFVLSQGPILYNNLSLWLT